MERAYGSSRKLYDALEGVEREWANSPVQFVQYMEALRDKMSCPDLTTVLDHAGPVQVPVKAQVREVAKLMKEYHTTAVLVMDHGGLAGIFTVSLIYHQEGEIFITFYIVQRYCFACYCGGSCS
jgi:hypothetical protein